MQTHANRIRRCTNNHSNSWSLCKSS